MGSALPSLVDLGLPSGILWATANLGAGSDVPQGLYFSWGNTDGHYFGDGYSFSSANYANTPGHDISGSIPETADAAHVMLGDGWRIPSRADFTELINNTFCYREHRGAKDWWVLVSKINRKVIEFPAGGNLMELTEQHPNDRLFLWSSSGSDATLSFYLRSQGAALEVTNISIPRARGMNIRPVFIPTESRGGDDRRDVPDDDPTPEPEPDKEKKSVRKSRKKSAS